MISLVIPTMDRSAFVIRTLRYYQENGFRGRILIGDSSKAEHRGPTEDFVRKARGRLDVVYQACPGLNERETLRLLSERVETPYVTFIGDDDFVLLPGLAACASFLDANSDYVAANGHAWAFHVPPAHGTAGVYGEMRIYDAYPQPNLEQARAADRVRAHLANYTVSLFSLHRAAAWREMWREAPLFDDRAFGAELYPCMLSAVLGKLKTLDVMYLLRQGHDQRYLLPGAAAWMSAPRWRANFEMFRDMLAARLSTSGEVSRDAAVDLVEKSFVSGYLARFPERDQYFPWVATPKERPVPVAAAAAPEGAPSAAGVSGLRAMFRRAFKLYWHIRTALATPATPAAPPPANPYAALAQKWLDPEAAEYAAFAPAFRTVSTPRDER